jgi:hypothetical protein
MKLKRRIEALESLMLSAPVILHFADGSTKEIRGRRGFLLKLYAGQSGEELDPEQAEQLELVRRCIRAEEPGGGRLIAMMKALMPEPGDDCREQPRESCSAVCPKRNESCRVCRLDAAAGDGQKDLATDQSRLRR